VNADRLARVEAAMAAAGLDAFIVSHPPNIRYLTGLDASTAVVVVSRGSATLVVDFRYAAAARALAGPTLAVEVANGSLDDAAAAVLRAAPASRVGVEGESFSVARFNRLASLLARPQLPLGDGSSGPALMSTERLMGRIRAVKDAGEIAVLREAGHRLSEVARQLRHWARPGRTEREVAALIDDAMRGAGFERPAFETIVASGPNGALPHARPTARRLAAGDGVVLDFGGVYDGYCVDLTRTVSLGPMSDGFRRLFDAVRDAQTAALAAVMPGAAAADIDGAARWVLETRGLGEAFGHGTGHGLGLEVHEEPRISRHTAPDERVQPGMVFTVEPGAYVQGLGGVRIEDDVLVVAGGCELLTNVPIEL
jgi:Xaa-Pro aminopeptidase